MAQTTSRVLALFAVAALAACPGGGGSDSGSGPAITAFSATPNSLPTAGGLRRPVLGGDGSKQSVHRPRCRSRDAVDQREYVRPSDGDDDLHADCHGLQWHQHPDGSRHCRCAHHRQRDCDRRIRLTGARTDGLHHQWRLQRKRSERRQRCLQRGGRANALHRDSVRQRGQVRRPVPRSHPGRPEPLRPDCGFASLQRDRRRSAGWRCHSCADR